MMKRYASWLLRLIGPALLLLFLWTSDITKIVASLKDLTLWPLLLSLALMLPFIVIKGWRWNLLMRELGLEAPPLRYSMTLYTIGLFLGGTTPGQSGDFVKGWYLRRRALPLTPVLFSIVLDRLFDFLIMAIIALMALFEFLDLLPGSARIATVLFAAAVIVLTPTLIARRPRDWLMSLLQPLMPLRLHVLVDRWRDQLSALSLRPRPLMLVLLASILSALSTMIRIYLLYVALGLWNVPLLAVFSSTALIAILQALPISFAGIGVRDAVLIAVLGRYGYPRELALSLSTLFLLVNIEHIVVGFLVSLRHPLGAPPENDAAVSVEGEQRPA
jgi:uncharacterized protein (TIRG00374 family)